MEEKRKRGNPNWVKGCKPANPNGRPKKGNSHLENLEWALREIEDHEKKSFWQHVLEQAYIDNRVLVAVMNKLVPNLEKSDQTHNFPGINFVIRND